MTILAVDNCSEKLLELSDILRKLHPSASVHPEVDSLMAAKYAFFHPVDILITEWNLKHMDGVRLADFVRAKCPNVQIYLTASQKEFDDSVETFDDVTALLPHPVTEEALCGAMNVQPALYVAPTGNACMNET